MFESDNDVHKAAGGRTVVREFRASVRGSHSGEHEWFDWWRIVTIVLTVFFLIGGVLSFVGAEQSRQDYAECKAEEAADLWDGSNWCEWDDWSGVYTVVGLYSLAIAGCFGLATLLASGSGGRRVFTVIGLALISPWLIGALVFVGQTHPAALAYGITTVTLAASIALAGRIVSRRFN